MIDVPRCSEANKQPKTQAQATTVRRAASCMHSSVADPGTVLACRAFPAESLLQAACRRPLPGKPFGLQIENIYPGLDTLTGGVLCNSSRSNIYIPYLLERFVGLVEWIEQASREVLLSR